MAARGRTSAARAVDPLAGASDAARIYEVCSSSSRPLSASLGWPPSILSHEPTSFCACQDASGVAWSFMLNYTDISYGSYGNNKFYMVQLIDEGGRYKVFRKWGRVGAANPQRATESYQASLAKAQLSFQKKFMDKSANEWPLTTPFERVRGKYVLVELDDRDPEADADDDDNPEIDASAGAEPKEVVPSSLPDAVQDVMKLICDADLIAQEMEKLKIDLKRLPLGRLSKAQISQGYSLLQQLSNTLTEIAELQKQDANGGQSTAVPTKAAAGAGTRRSTRPKRASTTNASKIRTLKSELKDLTSDFFTLIPHDFGRALPPVIDSMAEVKLKIDLLEVLADVEISLKLQQEKRKAARASGAGAINPLDAQYQMLNVKMEPLAESANEFKIIERYVETTHAPTHIQYKLKIRSIMKIARPSEDTFYDVFQSVGNHTMLWHGSRLSNVVGILSKGLRIAPPEAPSNGYIKLLLDDDGAAEGKDGSLAMIEQTELSLAISLRLTVASSLCVKGVLILAEVALGTPYEALEAEDLSYDSLKKSRGCDSTFGMGRMGPPAEHHEKMEGGAVVPIGEFEPTTADGTLMYNEYVVYRQEQVKLRYIVTLDFDYDV
ncbi:hypothetical protein PybrP1_011330 [[Pythium] brassicae (nom. inval.)]|nr:hypothetical protein PybrP1_011330 [[Pythium] brassicae (nom. inval.)]